LFIYSTDPEFLSPDPVLKLTLLVAQVKEAGETTNSMMKTPAQMGRTDKTLTILGLMTFENS